MTNYIYRSRSGYVTIVERVELPEGLSAQEAFDKHTDTFGTDNDLAFTVYDTQDNPEIVTVEADFDNDYVVWYGDENTYEVDVTKRAEPKWYLNMVRELKENAEE